MKQESRSVGSLACINFRETTFRSCRETHSLSRPISSHFFLAKSHFFLAKND